MRKVIGEKRPYNARPVPRSAEDKKKYFEKLVTEINKRGTGEGRLGNLLEFLRTNNKQKDLVMFRRVKINGKRI